jgi:hypothetical protein
MLFKDFKREKKRKKYLFRSIGKSLGREMDGSFAMKKPLKREKNE